ncbi:hypothetical protein COE25_19520 [Bacillus sp. AFS031507]|nr:hypothetical protein COE25_19520 [Bacillus sp. AFS031507]
MLNRDLYSPVKEGKFTKSSGQYNEGYTDNIYSFANNIHTYEGGTHESGFKTALTNPKGFEARKEGLYFVPSNEEKPPVFICSEYVLITGRYENITDGTEGLIVSWFHNNKWKRLKRSRDNFMVQSKLVELSAIGFPVSSLNQRLMVQYLTAFERANLENIPVEKASEQMGWSEDGFLLGNEFIGSGSLSFVSSDKGEEQFAKHYTSKGDLHPWLNMIEAIKSYPKVIAGV